MKLLGTPTSPYARKVRVVLAEKKIDYDWVVDSPNDPGSSVATHNPLARIPVLVLDDGTAIFDSPVIVEYLDNLSPNNKLFPQPNRERTEVKRWEAVSDGVLDAAVAIRLDSLRPAGDQSEKWMNDNRKVIEAGLAFMSRELADKTWCMGTHFTFADAATGCALGYLLFRFPEIAWQGQYANLAKLYDKLLQRPSFADTVPLG